MRATHDLFSDHVRSRLETVGMGLGLVRLLLDAGLLQEARTTLNMLENGSQLVAKSNESSRKPCKTKRMKNVSRSLSAKRLTRRSAAA